GIPYLFTLEERYELAGDDGGTRLTHSCTLRGALSLPFAAMMLRRLRSLMIEADDRLATYLRWRVGQPARGINRQRVPS
ncbi:SRPBCC domain-containing protein, partial [Rhizobium brockwellii]